MSVLCPGNVAQAQEMLADCRERKQSLTITGAGTHIPPRGDLQLKTTGLTGIRFFEPTDMVVGVEAGLPFAKLQEMLSAKGMSLPVAPWFQDATVGGVVAANEFGPERMNRGGIRDYIIGIEYINGAAQRVKGGGRVVKNVTGYDLGKMMTGSLGGLGLITAVNFKLDPAPVAPRALYFTMGSNHWFHWFKEEVHLKRLPLDWCQAVYNQGSWQLGMGVSGNPERQARLTGQLQTVFDHQLVVKTDNQAPRAMKYMAPEYRTGGFLTPHLPKDQTDLVHLHVVAPTSAFLSRARIMEYLTNLELTLILHPVGGDLHIVGRPEVLVEDTVDRIRRQFTGTGAYMVLERVSPQLLDVFGYSVPLPGEYPLMQMLKSSLDPNRLFLSPFYEII